MAENVREIVAEWLKDNGFDGLYQNEKLHDDCKCELSDLCDECGGWPAPLECKPGFRTECTCPQDPHDFHIGPAPEKKESGV